MKRINPKLLVKILDEDVSVAEHAAATFKTAAYTLLNSEILVANGDGMDTRLDRTAVHPLGWPA